MSAPAAVDSVADSSTSSSLSSSFDEAKLLAPFKLLGRVAIQFNVNDVDSSRESAPLPSAPASILYLVRGSLLDFTGDAIVNAANEGGVTGFGIDELVNRSAGDMDIKIARKAFGGIPTGQAKVTPSFKHTKVKSIIHAVGPVYRRNALKPSNVTDEQKDELLRSAYTAALTEAAKLRVTTLGVCPLSAGVFRGERSLEEIVAIGFHALRQQQLAQELQQDQRNDLRAIVFIAYTTDEENAFRNVLRTWELEEKAASV